MKFLYNKSIKENVVQQIHRRNFSQWIVEDGSPCWISTSIDLRIWPLPTTSVTSEVNRNFTGNICLQSPPAYNHHSQLYWEQLLLQFLFTIKLDSEVTRNFTGSISPAFPSSLSTLKLPYLHAWMLNGLFENNCMEWSHSKLYWEHFCLQFCLENFVTGENKATSRRILAPFTSPKYFTKLLFTLNFTSSINAS
jgi:hypothetical protein